ncbi:polymorphic toxin-type HINT domain-containing protein [Streptomyces massasporeus]
MLLADGTTKEISKVKAGDRVLTAEPGKKTREVHEVKQVIVTKTDRDYVDVTVMTEAGPKTIQTTEHHQFYESTRDSWTQAGDLRVGQKLQNGEGAPTAIVEVTSYQADRTTYDLSIEGLHTYFVLAGGTAVLVHNDNADQPEFCQLPLFVLRDGETASPRQMGASRGGPTAKKTVPTKIRDAMVAKAQADGDGVLQCWRCGMTTTNADNVQIGHVNVARSKGGNLDPENLCIEGAACNSSAQNRGAPSKGKSCAERGGCGAGFRRYD